LTLILDFIESTNLLLFTSIYHSKFILLSMHVYKIFSLQFKKILIVKKPLTTYPYFFILKKSALSYNVYGGIKLVC